MHPVLEPKSLKHLLKRLRQRNTSVRLRNLDNVQQKGQHRPFMFEVNGPRNERMVVG